MTRAVTKRVAAKTTARKSARTAARRRDPLVKIEDQRRVVALWVAGASVPEISEALDVSRETVRRIRNDALEEAMPARDTAVAAAREIELQRLDRLQRGHWSAATTGHVGSARVVLACIDARAKLLGLHAPIKVDARVKSELDAQIEALLDELEGTGLAKREH